MVTWESGPCGNARVGFSLVNAQRPLAEYLLVDSDRLPNVLALRLRTHVLVVDPPVPALVTKSHHSMTSCHIPQSTTRHTR
jgi:hypothetical protein